MPTHYDQSRPRDFDARLAALHERLAHLSIPRHQIERLQSRLASIHGGSARSAMRANRVGGIPPQAPQAGPYAPPPSAVDAPGEGTYAGYAVPGVSDVGGDPILRAQRVNTALRNRLNREGPSIESSSGIVSRLRANAARGPGIGGAQPVNLPRMPVAPTTGRSPYRDPMRPGPHPLRRLK